MIHDSDWVFIMCFDGVLGKWRDSSRNGLFRLKQSQKAIAPLSFRPLQWWNRNFLIEHSSSFFCCVICLELRHIRISAKKPMNQSAGCMKPRWRRCWRAASRLHQVQWQREVFSASQLASLAKTRFHFSSCINWKTKKKTIKLRHTSSS